MFVATVGRRTECGGLDDLRSEHHMHQAETAANDACATEQRFDLLWRGIGGDVEVLGLQTHDQVAYGAAHDVGFIAVLAKDFTYLDCMARRSEERRVGE